MVFIGIQLFIFGLSSLIIFQVMSFSQNYWETSHVMGDTNPVGSSWPLAYSTIFEGLVPDNSSYVSTH